MNMQTTVTRPVRSSDLLTTRRSHDAALRYLSGKGALLKLEHAVPVLGRDIVMWRGFAPAPDFDLPPLTVTRIG
jgi:hypothetical protein